MNHLDFEFDVRVGTDGRKCLHFPFISMSDIHLGADAQAERLCHWLDAVQADVVKLPGDIVDGEAIEESPSWSFGDAWHVQGLAHFLRKAVGGADTTFIPGNHDERALRLNGRTLPGSPIKIRQEDTYTDPRGRRFLIQHGHAFDDQGFDSPWKKRFWYGFADAFNFGFRQCDLVIHALRPKLRHDFSTAVLVKGWFRPAIYYVTGTAPIIRKFVDQSSYDGIIYGHSHESRFERTPHGKLVVNDGCSTEHIQALVHDRNGTWAQLTVNGHGLYIEPEPHGLKPAQSSRRFVSWQSLGLEDRMGAPAARLEDEFTALAERMQRLIYRAYPSTDRRKIRQDLETQTLAGRFDAAAWDAYRRVPVLPRQVPAAANQPKPEVIPA